METFNTPLKGDGRPTIVSYCTNKLLFVSHQKIMFILYRYDHPENLNILRFNKRNSSRPADERVSTNNGIPVVGYVHDYESKIMGVFESASTIMNEY